MNNRYVLAWSIIFPWIYASGTNFCILSILIVQVFKKCWIKKGKYRTFPFLKCKIPHERMATQGTKEDEIMFALSIHIKGRRCAPSKTWLLLYNQSRLICIMLHYCWLKNSINIITMALDKDIALWTAQDIIRLHLAGGFAYHFSLW